MRRAPACLTELLLKIHYHKIYYFFLPYNFCDLSFFFFKGQCVFSHALLLIYWLLLFSIYSSGTMWIFIQSSVISSDKSVTLKKKVLCIKIRFAGFKVAQVILVISKIKQGDLQKQYIILNNFQTSRVLLQLRHVENSVCNAFHQQIPWRNQQLQSTRFICYGEMTLPIFKQLPKQFVLLFDSSLLILFWDFFSSSLQIPFLS